MSSRRAFEVVPDGMVIAPPAQRRTPRRVRLGLRNRVSLGFGLMALGLSVLLAVVTWLLVSQYLMSERESAAWVQASDNATALQSVLTGGRADIPALLDQLPATAGEVSLLEYRGLWYSTGLSQGPSALPDALIALVRKGTPARQRIRVGDTVYLAVGVPLGSGGNAYYELFSLADLNRTYRVLSATLIAATIAVALLGLGAGWLAGKRAFRPLREFNTAAEEFMHGDMDVRLDVRDPDLAGLARSFNRAAETLQRRVIADARFAGDISHELRTPLTTMLNSMELLRHHQGELPPAMREPLDLLGTDLERFRRLVIDLIEISRDDGGDPHGAEPVRIADLVRQAADTAAGRPVTRVGDDVSGMVILADKRRLERVIANLVENAENYGDGCVEVGVARENTSVIITVDDDGPGVPVAHRERIFHRFARETDRQGPGVGLGLAIAARHVAWHGGGLTVTDRPGGGARFVVRLPAEGGRQAVRDLRLRRRP